MKKHVFKWWWADKPEKIELYLEKWKKRLAFIKSIFWDVAIYFSKNR